jgi:nicotinate phosphoribosyltransferase
MMHHPTDPDKFINLQGRKQEALLQPVMQKGKVIDTQPSLKEISDYSQHRLTLLADEHKRFNNPHIYKVGISEHLRKERDQLKKMYKK